jgi:segregation and condensation protein A
MPAAMSEYRVNLEIYNGPLDLLLYLIRREEVDIYDIPIARVTDQYIQYVELLQQVDPNLAGDFLVLAATLIEIKTRMLLPTVAPEEAGEDSLEIDPRAELVRQLLEYKAFKDAAGDLQEAAAARALKFPRRPVAPELEGEAALDLEDAQVWDLLEAFRKVMESIGQAAVAHQVIYDDTPIELWETDILDRLEREGAMTFERVFAGRSTRGEILGLFLALLELVRLKRVLANQDSNFGDIRIALNPDPPDDSEDSPGDRDDTAAEATEAGP